MPYTNLSDGQTQLAVLNPVGFSSATTRVGWVDLGLNERVQFIVNVGFTGAGEGLTASVQQATDTNGTGAKALSPAKAITSITASNKTAVVNVVGTDLDVNGGFRYAGLLITCVTSITTAASGSIVSAICLGQPDATPPTAASGEQIV